DHAHGLTQRPFCDLRMADRELIRTTRQLKLVTALRIGRHEDASVTSCDVRALERCSTHRYNASERPRRRASAFDRHLVLRILIDVDPRLTVLGQSDVDIDVLSRRRVETEDVHRL